MKYPPEKGTFREEDLLRALLFDPDRARSVLLADSGAAHPGRACEWDSIVESSEREGVSAVLFHNLRTQRLADRIPQRYIDALSNQYHNNLRRNLSLIGGLRKVLTALQAADILCIVLKGIALAECIYPNIALRGMSDVDLLVKKKDLLRADDCLSRLGYSSRDSSAAAAVDNPVGYLASLEYRKDDVSPLNLHLHWHPVNTSVPATAFVEGIDLDRLWEKAEPTRVADSDALMLCPEHLIIYLCEHALRVGHSFDRLILVCDIYFTLRAFANRIDWEFLVQESRRFGLARFVYHGLTIVRHHTGLGILDETIATLKPADLSWGERLFLRLQLSDRRIRGSSYLVHLAMNQGLVAKIGLIFRTFFPPRQVLLQRRHGKDSDPTKLYYLSRAREVVSHVSEFFPRDCGKINL
jgi:hypothetical protein